MSAKPSYEELERRVQALEKLESDHNHSKKALQESERLFKILYEYSPFGYQSLDEDGRFIVVNQTWLDILGYTREEVIGKSFTEFLHPDWRDHFKENFPRFKSIGEILGIEFEMVKKNGDLILVAFNGKIGRDQDGRFLHTHCILDEITERRRAEKQLKESEEKFTTLIQQSPFVVEIYDIDGLQISVNKAYEELWDFPAETTLNKFNVLESKEVEETGLLEYVKRAYAGYSVDVPDYFFDPSGDTEAKGVGRRRWLNTRIYPLKDESGKIKNVVIVHQDITERKQAEEEYLKFFTITEKALLGSAIADPEGNLVYVNGYFAQIHGYTVKELIGRNLDIFHSDAQMPLVRKTIEDVLEKGNIDALEIPHLHKNRHEFPMLMSLAVINDSLGKPKYIAATAFDLTEQKSAQKKLQHTVNDQNLMLNNDPTLIYFKDCYNNIIRVTESVAKATGLTREEIEGRPSKEIYPDMADKYWEDDLEVIKSGKPKHNIVEPMTSVEGSSHWLLTTKVPVKNDSGEIVGICVFATDITDLKNAELGLIAAKEKTEESEERFLLAMKASHDGLFDWNLQTNEIYYSPAWKKILGYEDHELPNDFSIWENFTDPVDIKKSWEMQQKLISKQIDRFVFEFKMKHKDGHWVDILSRAEAFFNDSGKAVRMVGTHVDITARKQAEAEKERLEAQLQQAQKMESVGRLAGGVAHDFNNMLGVIFGHTEMALEVVDPAAPLYASLQAIQHAAERSAALTRQLLAFARKQTVAPKVINLNVTVAGMLNMLRRLIGEDIDLLWCPGEDLPSIKIDPAQIDQLLANLCVNARDAIEGVGKITIETDRKTFDAAYCADHLGFLPGEYLLLAVSDDGCGMDQAVLNQIFEPFFTTKEQGKGTGLGLASVFGMVKQNNGFINVYSEPGQGTTFKIYLPAFASKSAWVTEKEQELPTEHGHETVLLVEDEPAILQMTTMMLERLGYSVVAAATPGEAIHLAHEYRGKIDLLMTDVVMPEMNGRQLAGNLLSHYPDLKRLFMSGYTANVIAHHGVLDEGVHFIQKPFSMKDLGEKLREALEG